jgi:hypothetical protein
MRAIFFVVYMGHANHRRLIMLLVHVVADQEWYALELHAYCMHAIFSIEQASCRRWPAIDLSGWCSSLVLRCGITKLQDGNGFLENIQTYGTLVWQ